jgi:hypothetical protein
MHYIDLQKINVKTRKGRLIGMLIVFIFALIVMLIMMNLNSMQETSINSNIFHYIITV